jgi:hypothetical protein
MSFSSASEFIFLLPGELVSSPNCYIPVPHPSFIFDIAKSLLFVGIY